MTRRLFWIPLVFFLCFGGAIGCAFQPTDYFNSGLDLDNQGKYDQAIVQYSKAIQSSPDSEQAYLKRGYDYIRTLQFDLAVGDLDKALELNPNDESAYVNRGIALINEGFRDKAKLNLAVADLSKALALNPDDPVALHNRGFAYALNGQTSLAAADLNRALQLSKDPATIQHAQQILSEMGQGTMNQYAPGGAQVWELTEDERHQVVKVFVLPYTYTRTFTETSDSPGWWIFDSAGNPMYKLPVGGNIFHSSQGDSWDFVNFGNAGGGYQTLGRGEGTANGSFPGANAVSGKITFTTQSRLGTVTGTVKWSGYRLQ